MPRRTCDACSFPAFSGLGIGWRRVQGIHLRSWASLELTELGHDSVVGIPVRRATSPAASL
jgi:hypothetical protein